MKVIGKIHHQVDDQGYVTDDRDSIKYLGGNIVILSKHEMGALKILQDACNGLRSDLFRVGSERLDNAMMDDLFMLVCKFAEAKFAINDFKGKIKELESILEGNKDDL